mgnify:CR=1 FL=1
MNNDALERILQSLNSIHETIQKIAQVNFEQQAEQQQQQAEQILLFQDFFRRLREDFTNWQTQNQNQLLNLFSGLRQVNQRIANILENRLAAIQRNTQLINQTQRDMENTLLRLLRIGRVRYTEDGREIFEWESRAAQVFDSILRFIQRTTAALTMIPGLQSLSVFSLFSGILQLLSRDFLGASIRARLPIQLQQRPVLTARTLIGQRYELLFRLLSVQPPGERTIGRADVFARLLGIPFAQRGLEPEQQEFISFVEEYGYATERSYFRNMNWYQAVYELLFSINKILFNILLQIRGCCIGFNFGKNTALNSIAGYLHNIYKIDEQMLALLQDTAVEQPLPAEQEQFLRNLRETYNRYLQIENLQGFDLVNLVRKYTGLSFPFPQVYNSLLAPLFRLSRFEELPASTQRLINLVLPYLLLGGIYYGFTGFAFTKLLPFNFITGFPINFILLPSLLLAALTFIGRRTNLPIIRALPRIRDFLSYTRDIQDIMNLSARFMIPLPEPDTAEFETFRNNLRFIINNRFHREMEKIINELQLNEDFTLMAFTGYAIRQGLTGPAVLVLGSALFNALSEEQRRSLLNRFDRENLNLRELIIRPYIQGQPFEQVRENLIRNLYEFVEQNAGNLDLYTRFVLERNLEQIGGLYQHFILQNASVVINEIRQLMQNQQLPIEEQRRLAAVLRQTIAQALLYRNVFFINQITRTTHSIFTRVGALSFMALLANLSPYLGFLGQIKYVLFPMATINPFTFLPTLPAVLFALGVELLVRRYLRISVLNMLFSFQRTILLFTGRLLASVGQFLFDYMLNNRNQIIRNIALGIQSVFNGLTNIFRTIGNFIADNRISSWLRNSVFGQWIGLVFRSIIRGFFGLELGERLQPISAQDLIRNMQRAQSLPELTFQGFRSVVLTLDNIVRELRAIRRIIITCCRLRTTEQESKTEGRISLLDLLQQIKDKLQEKINIEKVNILSVLQDMLKHIKEISDTLKRFKQMLITAKIANLIGSAIKLPFNFLGPLGIPLTTVGLAKSTLAIGGLLAGTLGLGALLIKGRIGSLGNIAGGIYRFLPRLGVAGALSILGNLLGGENNSDWRTVLSRTLTGAGIGFLGGPKGAVAGGILGLLYGISEVTDIKNLVQKIKTSIFDNITTNIKDLAQRIKTSIFGNENKLKQTNNINLLELQKQIEQQNPLLQNLQNTPYSASATNITELNPVVTTLSSIDKTLLRIETNINNMVNILQTIATNITKNAQNKNTKAPTKQTPRIPGSIN